MTRLVDRALARKYYFEAYAEAAREHAAGCRERHIPESMFETLLDAVSR